MSEARPLLEVTDLVKHYPVRGGVLRRRIGTVHAVDGVSFSVGAGETLGLVGESGCGKSTVARSVLRLVEPTSGAIRLNGDRNHPSQQSRAAPAPPLDADRVPGPVRLAQSAHDRGRHRRRAALRCMAWRQARRSRSASPNCSRQVGLRPDQMKNFPHQFSGGQRQRICIARALSLGPSLIVCDEPVSALDVSIQAQVINLLIDLQRQHDFSYLFIAHDLAVVAHISHRVAVMYLGRIVEIADKRELFANPRHPYTQALLASVPVADPKTKHLTPLIDGDVPSPINPPSGCAFHTRCRYVMDRCKIERPALKDASAGHQVACWLNEGTGRSG